MIRVIVTGAAREGKSTVAAAISGALSALSLPNIVVDSGENSAAEMLTEPHQRMDWPEKQLSAVRNRLLETGEKITIETFRSICLPTRSVST